MIRIGLNIAEKQAELLRYVQQNSIRQVFIFYPQAFPLPCSLAIETEHIEYADIIMYKFFYRLLEEIDNDCLLVFNECIRTQNRGDLTYNCAHHYCNQTGHKLIFEHFPFIETVQDFMILLDLQNKGRYKGRGFDWEMLQEEDVCSKPHGLSLETLDMAPAPAALEHYEKRKEQLFDNLGNADPDTIPRQLHLFAGNLKKGLLDPGHQYVARNDRFKLSNVTTYRNVARPGEYILIDMPHRRLDMNDFLKRSGLEKLTFINSGLKVDLYYIDQLRQWMERVREFDTKASLYTG